MCARLSSEAEASLSSRLELEDRARSADARVLELQQQVATLETTEWREQYSRLEAELEERSRLVDTWCAKVEDLESQLARSTRAPASVRPTASEPSAGGWKTDWKTELDKYALPFLRMLAERQPLRQLFIAHLLLLYLIALIFFVKVDGGAPPEIVDSITLEKSGR
jgi:hypothetical protein